MGGWFFKCECTLKLKTKLLIKNQSKKIIDVYEGNFFLIRNKFEKNFKVHKMRSQSDEKTDEKLTQAFIWRI